MPAAKILVFSGSIRSGALSSRLAAAAAAELGRLDASVTLLSLADYPLPLYDGDLEAGRGIPEQALALARLLAANEGAFIVTPEYNHSLPPLLKNAIDWVSRLRAHHGISYRHRAYALAGSSDGAIGGARAVADLRRVLAHGWGAMVIPEQMTLPHGQNAFDEAGRLTDERQVRQLRGVCERLIDAALRFAGPG
jgi:NAD(P)H-dependent FMN reductase